MAYKSSCTHKIFANQLNLIHTESFEEGKYVFASYTIIPYFDKIYV